MDLDVEIFHTLERIEATRSSGLARICSVAVDIEARILDFNFIFCWWDRKERWEKTSGRFEGLQGEIRVLDLGISKFLKLAKRKSEDEEAAAEEAIVTKSKSKSEREREREKISDGYYPLYINCFGLVMTRKHGNLSGTRLSTC